MLVSSFQYGDKFYDPIRSFRLLCQKLQCDPNDIVDRCNSKDTITKSSAIEVLVSAVRFAFNLPFNDKTGEGLLEDEVLLLWNKYARFLSEKKKSIKMTQTSVEHTDSSQESCHLKADLDCGLMRKG